MGLLSAFAGLALCLAVVAPALGVGAGAASASKGGGGRSETTDGLAPSASTIIILDAGSSAVARAEVGAGLVSLEEEVVGGSASAESSDTFSEAGEAGEDAEARGCGVTRGVAKSKSSKPRSNVSSCASSPSGAGAAFGFEASLVLSFLAAAGAGFVTSCAGLAGVGLACVGADAAAGFFAGCRFALAGNGAGPARRDFDTRDA